MAECTGSRTLTLGVEHGRSNVVQMLLTRDELTPNIPAFDGQTALAHASQHCKLMAVYQLLLYKDIDPNMADTHLQTLLLWDARMRNAESVRMLLKGRMSTPMTREPWTDTSPLYYRERKTSHCQLFAKP